MIRAPSRFKNPLIFPGDRLPGLDRSHVAFSAGHGLKLSAVPLNGNFARTDSGLILGTVTGSLSAGLNGRLGPVVTSASRASTQSITFTRSLTVNVVMAAIFVVSTLASAGVNDVVLACGASTNITMIGVGTSGFIARTSSGSTTLPGVTPRVGAPYFVAFSCQVGGGTVSWVVSELDTGKIYSGTFIPPVQPLNTSTIGILNNNGGSSSLAGSVAAIAVLDSGLAIILPPTALTAWAADPWSFWYPPNVETVMGTSFPPQPFTRSTKTNLLIHIP